MPYEILRLFQESETAPKWSEVHSTNAGGSQSGGLGYSIGKLADIGGACKCGSQWMTRAQGFAAQPLVRVQDIENGNRLMAAPMAFALAAYAIVMLLLFYDAFTIDFQEPTPRRYRFSVRGLLLVVSATALLFGLAAVFSAH
jgi:hypothetical protein